MAKRSKREQQKAGRRAAELPPSGIGEHPSGEGMILCAPGYDPLWLREDGSIQEISTGSFPVEWPGSSHRPAHDAEDGDIRQRMRGGTI